MSNISRRSALAGTATAALIAAVPLAAAVVPVVSAVNDADAKLIAAWREWNKLEDAVHAVNLAHKWAIHHGESAQVAKLGNEAAKLGKRVDPLIAKINKLPATTPAGFLCKLDLAMEYGPAMHDALDDYPWALLIALQDSITQAVPGMVPGWRARYDRAIAVAAEIEAREENDTPAQQQARDRAAFPEVFAGRN